MRLFLVMTLATAGTLLAAGKPAKVELKDGTGKTVGSATIKEAKGGVRVSGRVQGMPAGVHAVHIHQTGNCTAPDFKSAGPHFNPTNKQHGDQNPQGHHVGDLPNFSVDAKGKGRFTAMVQGATLEGTGANSLFKEGGTALVVHAKEDDRKSDPAGNAGDRIACGVISR